MSFLEQIDPLYSLSGFVVGLLVGQTGVGGGSLMTPLLVLAFGIHPSTAVGTDLLYAAATKTAGTLVHGLNKTVDWRVTGLLAAGSLPATALTLFCLSRFSLVDPMMTTVINTILGVALILTAASLFLRARIFRLAGDQFAEFAPSRRAWLTVATGAALGILVSMSSVGAGAVGVTALFLLYPRLPTATIIGSDIAHAVPLTLAAGVGHWMLGSVDWHLLGSLLTGSLPGIVIGSYFAAKVPEFVLRPLLASVLVLVGGRLVL
jgi:uncharacterized membrane protein YfcA